MLWRSDGEIRLQFLTRRTAESAAIRPRVADVPSRHRLRSSTSDDLIVPAVRLTSIGSRAFPVAGARIQNKHATACLPSRTILDRTYSAQRFFIFSYFYIFFILGRGVD